MDETQVLSVAIDTESKRVKLGKYDIDHAWFLDVFVPQERVLCPVYLAKSGKSNPTRRKLRSSYSATATKPNWTDSNSNFRHISNILASSSLPR